MKISPARITHSDNLENFRDFYACIHSAEIRTTRTINGNLIFDEGIGGNPTRQERRCRRELHPFRAPLSVCHRWMQEAVV
jgi:hypothetical protein